MRDTSLDEFVGGDDEATTDPQGDDEATTDPQGDDEATDGPDGEGSPEQATDTTNTPEAVEQENQQASAGGPGDGHPAEPDAESPESSPSPAVSTFEWTPGGVACSSCGETVTARWRDDDELVCATCKTW